MKMEMFSLVAESFVRVVSSVRDQHTDRGGECTAEEDKGGVVPCKVAAD